MRWQITVVAVLVCASTSSRADTPAKKDLCIIGRTECETIVILESSLALQDRIAGHTEGDRLDLVWTGEVGTLENLWPRQGIGASLGLTSLVDTNDNLILRARYRYWLSRNSGAEASIGYLGLSHVSGVRTQFTIETADQIGIFFGVDMASTRAYGFVTDVAFGIRFGGYVGVPLTVLGFLVGSAGNG